MSAEEDKPDTGSDELVSQFLAFTGSSDPKTATNYLEMSGNVLDTAVGLYFEHQGAGGGSSSRSSSGGGRGGSSSRGTGTSSSDFGGSDFGSYAAAAGGSSSIGGGGSGDMLGEDGVRAPDASRRMRLLDFDNDRGPGAASAMAAMNHPAALLASGMLSGAGMDHDVDGMMSAFSSSGPAVRRAAGSASSGLGIDLTGSGGPGVFDARAAVNAAAAAAVAGDNAASGEGDESGDQDDSVDAATAASIRSASRAATLSDIFSPPTNIMHRGGGFLGARNVARDSRRWLIVNLQSDSEFACHALNRDVWRDDLVEGLVKEGFIFWQSTDTLPDGQTYVQRYNVNAFPHVGIIDPRTARLMWRKEGWTQANPMTATQFAEIAADFCSRHSFDKPPVAPRQTDANGTSAAARPAKRPIHELTEQQQLQAAIAASMNDGNENDDDNDEGHDEPDDEDSYVMDDDDDDVVMESDEEVVIDDDDDEVECMGSKVVDTTKPAAAVAEEVREVKEEEKKPPTLEEELATMDVGDEPAGGDVARVQIRMPDGKRLVRKFRKSDAVKVIYAFVAQSNEEAKNGKSFGLKAGFPPRDLKPDIDSTIESCGLAGEAITVRWS